jgi:L-rhamnose mutarotase
MRHHYLRLLEKELKRLWINQYSILITEQGKDKFMFSDGKRGFIAKGHIAYAAMKKIPDKAGYQKFWEGMREVEKANKIRPKHRR